MSDEVTRCFELDKWADDVAVAIEQDLRNILPLASGISAQAEVSFRPGSIILEGSLILLSWAGRTALEPIRDELGSLIKTITKRAISRVLENCGVVIDDLAATPVPGTPKEAAQTPSAMGSVSLVAPQSARGVTEQPWLIALLGLLTILVLIVLCDLLFFQAESRRMAVSPAAPLIEAPRSGPAAPTSAVPAH